MNATRYIKAALGAALALLAACTINPVTGDRELALISADQEVEIGQEQYAPSQQMQGGDYAFDPALTTYVRGVGAKLAAVSGRALPYEFVVLNNSVPNAWALPGGKIAVNRGLLTELHPKPSSPPFSATRSCTRPHAMAQSRCNAACCWALSSREFKRPREVATSRA